jgi:hypothetical protein
MPKPAGAATRTMLDLSIGQANARRDREQRDRQMGLSELMQQFEIDFSGAAGTLWGFATQILIFDFPFYYAPGQRDPDFANPHFWFGAEARPAVAVSVTVTDWLFDDDNGAIIGAHVAIGVCGNVPNATPYTGTAHLTFQGFSALAEDEADFDDVGLVE